MVTTVFWYALYTIIISILLIFSLHGNIRSHLAVKMFTASAIRGSEMKGAEKGYKCAVTLCIL